MKSVENLCEGMTIKIHNDGSITTCPVSYYLGNENCFINHPIAKQDITQKEICPIYTCLDLAKKYNC